MYYKKNCCCVILRELTFMCKKIQSFKSYRPAVATLFPSQTSLPRGPGSVLPHGLGVRFNKPCY